MKPPCNAITSRIIVCVITVCAITRQQCPFFLHVYNLEVYYYICYCFYFFKHKTPESRSGLKTILNKLEPT